MSLKNTKGFELLRRRKYLILIIVILIAIVLVYKSDKMMIELPEKAFDGVRKVTGLHLYPKWSKPVGEVFRLEDGINPFRFRKNLLNGELPIYNLELSANDLRHFDNLSKHASSLNYKPDEANTWRNAKLQIDGNEYDVEVRFHGDGHIHWAHDLKSYQIKTKKDEYIDSMRRFSFILFEDRYTTPVVRHLEEAFGLFKIRGDVVVLRINGVLQGMYYLQERLDETSLENNECSSCFVVGLSDNRLKDHSIDGNGLFWKSSHLTPFDYEFSNSVVRESIPNATALMQLNVKELFDSIYAGDPGIIDHFDIDYLSSFEAYRTIAGIRHVAGDNLKMVYRATNKKFYPAPSSEDVFPIFLERGGFESDLNKFAGKPIQLFHLLHQSDEMRYLRNQKLYDYVTSNDLLEFYDEMVENYQPYAVSYKTNTENSRIIKHNYKKTRGELKNNLRIVKENLEYSRMYVGGVKDRNTISLELIPDSIAELKFNTFKLHLEEAFSGPIELTYTNPRNKTMQRSLFVEEPTTDVDLIDIVSDLYMSAGLDEHMHPEKRYYSFDVTLPGSDVLVDTVTLSFRNDITGVTILPEDTYIQIADGDHYIAQPSSFELFQEQYPEFVWRQEGGVLRLERGFYAVTRDVIIPSGYQVIIDAGTTLALDEDVVILSYSPVNFLGTESAPITVRALSEGKAFGTFAIVGTGSEEITMHWLDFSGGNEAWINGMYFSGQFAINHLDVKMDHATIHGSISDDGMNIKYSDVVIENSHFYDNAADQVDLDFVTGIVKNSRFDGKDSVGGDNLDFSGSRVLVTENTFTGSSDKGVSIGEKTDIVLFRNTIDRNEIGVAVKDLSKAYLVENTIERNSVGIDAYQKKPLFGGGFVYNYENTLQFNEKDMQKDELSKFFKLNLKANSPFLQNLEREILTFPADSS